MKIDLHNHVVPPPIVDAIAANPSRYGTKFELKDGKRYFTVHGPLAELKPEFYDVDAKVAWLDRVGLDVAVISVGPPIFFYGLSPAVGLEAARHLINMVGADRVVIGTDHPFDMGPDDVVGSINATPGLTEAEREQVYGVTARFLLGEN